jgi:hypothetical protein
MLQDSVHQFIKTHSSQLWIQTAASSPNLAQSNIFLFLSCVVTISEVIMMSSMLLQAQTASFFKDGVGMLEYLWAL